MQNQNQKLYILLITMVAALGGFLFGFDMAVVSGIIEPIKSQYKLSSAEEGLFVSCALLGCIIGVAFSGYLSDKIGRRKVLFLSAILFFISTLGFSFSETYHLLVVFRILAGIGVGVASNISPLYISEIAPAKNRGGLVVFYQLAITTGILCAYISNLFIHRYGISHPDSLSTGIVYWLFSKELWRGMFIVGLIPAFLFFILLLLVPESPRWLIQYGKDKEGLKILKKINGAEKSEIEWKAIKEAASGLNHARPRLLNSNLRKLLLLSIVLTALSQFSGINAVIFYGPTILKSAGIVTNEALLYQVILGTANMLFTIFAIWKVDSWGRRPLYIFGSLSAAVALLLAGISWLIGITGWGLLLCILLFLLFFAFSLGPLKFVIATELFPTQVRATALSISIMTMWIADWLVNLLFPLLRDKIGIPFTFFIFSFFCFLSFIYAKKNLPETKGKTLEEINTYSGTIEK